MNSVDSEQKLLEEFHRSAGEKDAESQAGAIRNGYLPETPEVLVQAGIMCIPLIESDTPSISDAGKDRLKAIIFKLKLVQDSANARSALEQFEKLVEKGEKKASRETVYGFLLIGGLIVLVTVVIFLMIRMFIK